MIKYIENVITPSYANEIQNDVLNNLTYKYTRETSVETEEYKVLKDKNTFDYGQFVMFVMPALNKADSEYINFLKPLMFSIFDKVPELNFTNLSRTKLNLLLQQPSAPENHYNIPHHDMPAESGFYSVIYYCLDSDGDTVLFDKFADKNDPYPELKIVQRFTPKKNSILVFESNRFHASSNPRNHKERAVINFIFQATEKK